MKIVYNNDIINKIMAIKEQLDKLDTNFTVSHIEMTEQEHQALINYFPLVRDPNYIENKLFGIEVRIK